MKQSQGNGQKPLFLRQEPDYFGDTFFISKIGLPHFRPPYGGKYENFALKTVRQIQGRSWLHRTREGYGGYKNQLQ